MTSKFIVVGMGSLVAMAGMLAATDWNPLVIALAGSIPGLIALLAAWMNLNSRQNKQDEKIAIVEKVTNGLTKELVAKAEAGALVRGAIEEQARVATENALIAQGVSQERARMAAEETALAVGKEVEKSTLVVEGNKVVVDNEAKTPIVIADKKKTAVVPDPDHSKE